MKYWSSAYDFGQLMAAAVRIHKAEGVPLENFDVIQNGKVYYLVTRVG